MQHQDSLILRWVRASPCNVNLVEQRDRFVAEKWANGVLLLGLSSSGVKKFNRNRSQKRMEANLNVWAVFHDQEHQGKVPKAIMFVEDASTQDEVLLRARRQRPIKRKKD